MWQRFTERARRVILHGQEEAGKMGSGHVGTEHLLLGLLRETEGVGAQVLEKMGINSQNVREYIASQIRSDTPLEPDPDSSEPKLTPKSKQVLELASEEAHDLHHTYIGTEHLLLALLRQQESLAVQVLRNLGLDLVKVRTQVIKYLGTEEAQEQEEITKNSGPDPSAESDYAFRDIHDIMVAAMQAARATSQTVKAEHLLLALLAERGDLLAALFPSDWDEGNLRQRLLDRLEEKGGS